MPSDCTKTKHRRVTEKLEQATTFCMWKMHNCKNTAAWTWGSGRRCSWRPSPSQTRNRRPWWFRWWLCSLVRCSARRWCRKSDREGGRGWPNNHQVSKSEMQKTFYAHRVLFGSASLYILELKVTIFFFNSIFFGGPCLEDGLKPKTIPIVLFQRYSLALPQTTKKTYSIDRISR